MPRLHLVRHGRAAAGWDDHADPGLDELGRAQAAAVAVRLAELGKRAIVTSPMRRCRETAVPLATTWDASPEVVDAVGEIPSPPGVPMGGRVEWLRAAMGGSWVELEPLFRDFRDRVIVAALAIPVDTVVFSHFIAINAVIGAATGDDRLVIRRLDNCSVTVVDVDGGSLALVEGGHEADTLIR
jgi:broad specificity phosphatase PhoE